MNLSGINSRDMRRPLRKLECFAPDNKNWTDANDLEIDSRKILPGNAFLAIQGFSRHGLEFVEDAINRGASAILMEPSDWQDYRGRVPLIQIPNLKEQLGPIAAKFYDNPSEDIYTIGVTGTNGKTTTTHLIAQFAEIIGRSSGMIGTLGSFHEADFKIHPNTTPDAVTIQRTLASWRESEVEIAAIEVSSHALELGRVDGTQFDTAVFTNLSPDHLDFHQDMEGYGKAKIKLFCYAGLNSVVANFDDKFTNEITSEILPEVSCFKYSIRPETTADIKILKYLKNGFGVAGVMETPWGAANFESPLLGDCNLENLLAAVTSSVLAGADFQEVVGAIPYLKPVPGRFQIVKNDCGFNVIIDYAHTPKALEQAILALRPYVKRSLTTIFGCGGARDKLKRPEMGRIASHASDQVIITTDNPRNEPPDSILDDIEDGCIGDVLRIADRAEAISFAINHANTGDCILIAGKGHEEVQIFENCERRFSDLEKAKEALAKRISK